MSTDTTTTKRSIYMDASSADAIDVLAAAHLRTWSKQLEWLVRLGLRARHLLPDDVPPLDEGKARKYFYPGEIAGVLDELLIAKNALRTDGSKPWSFSSLIRVLVGQGMRVEQQVARGVDAALARLEAAGVATTEPAPRRLAVTLTLNHDAAELLGMLDEPPADIVTKWGAWVPAAWQDIVGAALACRGRLDSLEGAE